ncbi:MAG: HD domain-containing protein [Betaproteobacteria bacterium]|nr:HD domain-containing protein [Betaproteobacteria bacterium]
MNAFNKRTARRIGAVSLLLALLASPISWFVVRENVEQSTVSLAIEESQRLLGHFGAIALSGPGAATHADSAAKALAGGLFDIAEIYDGKGQRLAEAMTSNGLQVEGILLHHATPTYTSTRYESVKLPDQRWVLRVFVPLRLGGSPASEITGYFEGVRIVPEWQRQRMLGSSLAAALMAGLASLLCGLAIYPVVVRLSADNERKALEVLDSHISMMEALGRAIAKRDSETGAHNYRVAWIAGSIAEKFGFRGKKMQSLIVGSFLHDVGKIGIPDAILLKPGPLDSDELAIMQTHVQLGEEIVKGIGWLEGANKVVAGHHERWDGTGYPRRLKGEHIPLAARIFAVADVFDALCSRRPYKEPLNFETVMDILDRETGSHFDPDVMTAFRPMARDIYEHLADCSEEAASKMLEDRVRKHYGL